MPGGFAQLAASSVHQSPCFREKLSVVLAEWPWFLSVLLLLLLSLALLPLFPVPGLLIPSQEHRALFHNGIFEKQTIS